MDVNGAHVHKRSKFSTVKAAAKIKPDLKAKTHEGSTVKETSKSKTTTATQKQSQQFEKQQKSAKSETSFLGVLNVMHGLCVMIAISCVHSIYMYRIHENTLWFTNIKEVEREISFRTEAGLYYSYYKQVVHAPSLWKGIKGLMDDRRTEYPDSINILERMNVYQEVLLAAAYKTFGITMPPIFFYTYSVFALHGLLIAALYLTSWFLSGSWLAGLLTAAFYIFNREDTTRVEYTAALRECFSLPFLWMQAAALTVYFKRNTSRSAQLTSLFFIVTSTFLFCLFWQFNQFIIMLQAFSLFGVWILGLLPRNKARTVMFIQLLSLLAVCGLQFGNKMILGSLAVSFILVSLILMTLMGDKKKPHSIPFHVFKVICVSVLALILMVAVSKLIKIIFNIDSDEHIFKFLQNKFGVGDVRDFDSRIYLCLGIFGFITPDIFHRLSENMVLWYYVPAHLLFLAYLTYSVVMRWRQNPESDSKCDKQPNGKQSKEETTSSTSSSQKTSKSGSRFSIHSDLAFHTVQAVFFGLIAAMTMRMKYLWTPYMCILAAVGVADMNLWTRVLSLFKIKNNFMVTVIRFSVLVIILGILIKKLLPPVLKFLEQESEFWDPDTVELMEWIMSNTRSTASFTGSMQLLAGVKLCTGRPITNHPHYEDKYLRQKTRELYQIYGRREPEDVHAILKKYKSNYIILEDSICRAPSRGGCRTPDVVDIDNGVMPDTHIDIPGLVKSDVPRFCEAVRLENPKYARYFKSVFVNKTFRMYKVL